MDAVQVLVGAGYSLGEILHERQPGWPYGGWSMWQFWARFDAVMKARRMERAEFMASVHGAVAAMMDRKAGQRFQETVKDLTREEPEEIEARPVDPKKAAAVKLAMEQMAKKVSPQRHRSAGKRSEPGDGRG